MKPEEVKYQGKRMICHFCNYKEVRYIEAARIKQESGIFVCFSCGATTIQGSLVTFINKSTINTVEKELTPIIKRCLKERTITQQLRKWIKK